MQKLNKKDLQFIKAVVDKNNPKDELNFAHFDCVNNVVYATDTRTLLKFYCDLSALGTGKVLAHKQTLEAVCKIASGKKNTLEFANKIAIVGKTKISLDNFRDDAKTQNFANIGDKSGAYPFQCEPHKITFEVFKKGVLFNDYYMNALIKHSDGAGLKYNVFITSQNEPFIIEARNEENEIVFDYTIMPIITGERNAD